MRLIVSTAIVLMIAAFGILLTPAARASAATSCTAESQFTDSDAQHVWIPTVGRQTYNADCQLGLGNDNDAVLTLQNDLNACYPHDGVQTDGIFGQETMTALKAVQRILGITADGVYGPQTRDHIHWIDAGGNCALLPV